MPFFSCKQTKKEEDKNYIDVPGYLRGQLKYLDTVPFAFLKLTKKDSIFSDSQFIPKDQVKQLAESFLVDEIKKGNFEKYFTETTIADETLGLLTITYSLTSGKSAVNRIDVYVDPDKERISQLYMVKSESNQDSSAVQQLLWKHNKSFTLITFVSKKDLPEKITAEKVIWDDSRDQ
jgi:hypothetical protein